MVEDGDSVDEEQDDEDSRLQEIVPKNLIRPREYM